jgi:hypothetical protein
MPASTISIAGAPATSPTSSPPPEPIQAQAHPMFRILLICTVVLSIALVTTIIVVLS